MCIYPVKSCWGLFLPPMEKKKKKGKEKKRKSCFRRTNGMKCFTRIAIYQISLEKKKLKAGNTLEALKGFHGANEVHRLLPKKFLYSRL